MAERTKVEVWEERAGVAFFWAAGLSVFGGLFYWLVRPEVNVHSLMMLFVVAGIFAFVVAMGVAGIGGGIAAGVLFFRFGVFSRRGLLAVVIAVAVLLLLTLVVS